MIAEKGAEPAISYATVERFGVPSLVMFEKQIIQLIMLHEDTAARPHQRALG